MKFSHYVFIRSTPETVKIAEAIDRTADVLTTIEQDAEFAFMTACDGLDHTIQGFLGLVYDREDFCGTLYFPVVTVAFISLYPEGKQPAGFLQ